MSENDIAAVNEPLAPAAETIAGKGDAPAAREHTLLLVDDEPNVLTALQRALRADGYRFLTARGGREALDILEQESVALIISDQRMARMAGAEFLQQARKLQPDAVRIMLTGYAEPQAIVDAINKGEVYRFISKPWDDADLRLTLRRALDQYDLVMQNRALLAEVQTKNAALAELNQGLEQRVAERTAEVAAQRDSLQQLYERLNSYFVDTVRILASLLEMRNMYEGNHARRVAAAVRFVAERYTLPPEKVREFETAALLHDLGKIGMPDALLAKPERLLNGPERVVMRRHPLIGQALLHGIDGLRQIGLIIRHHHESYDGTGYPDGREGNNIPLGARLLAVANAYDRAIHTRDEESQRSPAQMVEEMRRDAGRRFDPEVVQHFVEYVKYLNRPKPGREMKIIPSLLKPGMVLFRDLETIKGLLLMVADTPLDEAHIERIENFHALEAIGPLYVYQPEESTAKK
jgi:response regulator RpfG family c-di-GMP phosphodiesterase